MKRAVMSTSALARVLAGVFLAGIFGSTDRAGAADITWSGSINTAFSNANNWVGNVAPTNTSTNDIAVFGSTLTANQPVLTANRSVMGLKFLKADGGWTLGGPTYILTPGASGIDDSANTSGITTIKPLVAGVNTMIFLVGEGGNLVLEAGITNTGNALITLDTGTLTLGGIFVSTTARTFSKRGAGTLALAGAAGPTFQGGFLLQAGKVVIGHKDCLGGAPFKPSIAAGSPCGLIEASIPLTGENTITNSVVWGGSNIVGGVNDITFSGPLTGPASGGAIILNSFGSGRKLLFSGPVALCNTAQVASISQTIAVGGSGTTEFSGDLSNGSLTNKGSITFGYTGSGITILSGANNTYTGETTVAAGVLLLKSANALPGGIGAAGGLSLLTLSGGVLGLGYADFNRSCTNANYTAETMRFTGSGGFAAYGADRNVNLGGAGAVMTWVAGNGSGNFVASGGTFILGAASADRTVTFMNPIVLATGSTVTNRTIQANNGAAEVDGVLAGPITHGSGACGLIKTGSGTLLLSVSNAYAGGTAVTAGELRVGGTAGSGAVTVSDGASISGTGKVASLTLLSGGSLKPYLAGAGLPSCLIVTGAFNLASGTLDLSGLTNTLASGTLTLAQAGSISGSSFASLIPGPPERAVAILGNTVVLKDVSARGTLMVVR